MDTNQVNLLAEQVDSKQRSAILKLIDLKTNDNMNPVLERMDTMLSTVNNRMDAMFSMVNNRMDTTFAQFRTEFKTELSEINHRMESLEKSTKAELNITQKIVFGVLGTLVAGILLAIIGFMLKK